MRLIALVALLLLTASPGFCGQGTTTGKEWGRWTEDGYSVIVATIQDVVKLEAQLDAGTHRAVLEPIATLAGALDPSATPHLDVRFCAQGYGTSIREAPPKGATVLAVVQLHVRQGDETQLSNWITSDICTFMPDRSALVVIGGLGDRRLIETLKRLQESRAHPDPSPYPPPTTRP